MDVDIKELIKTATENLNLKDFKGDVVAVKVVENEFGTIESGGIGIQNVYHNGVIEPSVAAEADDEVVLEPGIFKARIFDTNAKLVRLRDEIGAHIKGARLADESRFAPDRHQIDPKVQKDWYYIWKPLNESELFARNIKVGVTSFINQMLRWYPEVFPEFADEKARDKFINNLMQSISAEKSKWMKGDNEVPIKDMSASCTSLGLVYDNKIQSMFFVCNELRKGLGNMKMAQVH